MSMRNVAVQQELEAGQLEQPKPHRDKLGRLAAGGPSLNPGGRSRRLEATARIVRRLSMRAAERLGELLESPNDAVALGAAREILDRNFGKPKAQVDVAVTHTHELHLAALQQIAERAKQAIAAVQHDASVVDVVAEDVTN
jgi:hypothetical protein